MENRNKLSTIGGRIKDRRKELGYSQEKLAEILMIKQGTLSKYENDEHIIPSDLCKPIADALYTSVSYLLGDDDEDAWLMAMMKELRNIKNPSIKNTALEQIKALAALEKQIY